MLAIVAIVSYLLARERDNVELSAIRSSNNIVQLIESDILRNVELYDQSLQGLIWAVGRKELPEIPAPVRQRLLFNEAFVDRKRGDVLWLDKQGNVVGDSTSSVPRKANFGDTGVFGHTCTTPTSACWWAHRSRPRWVTRLVHQFQQAHPRPQWRVRWSGSGCAAPVLLQRPVPAHGYR